MRWKGRDVVFMVFLASMLIPWQINAVPLYFLMDFLNLLNTRIAVVLPIVAMPISVFLLRQFFVSVPRELEDTAKIDGLGTMGIIWRVIVPVSLPAISALVIYMFIFTWNEYFWSLVALQDTELFTIPIGLKALQGAHDIKYNLLMAGASMAAIPILIVYLILQRRIISGLAMSSK
jgi:ABC-type glycerol-3-phosphate transport system permease component